MKKNRTALTGFLAKIWIWFWFWLLISIAGLLYKVFYGRILGRLKKERERNLKIAVGAKLKRDISLVFLSNHKGLIEALLLPLLLWWEFTWYPSLVPVSTPDAQNFMDGDIFGSMSWWGKIKRWTGTKLMRLVPAIPIPRNSKLGSGRAFFAMRDMLDSGKGIVLTIFGEGGRTSSETDPANLRTENGRTIRRFQRGIVDLILKTREPFIILPVWSEGADKLWPRGGRLTLQASLHFHFNRPFLSSSLFHLGPDEIRDRLERAVLGAKKK